MKVGTIDPRAHEVFVSENLLRQVRVQGGIEGGCFDPIFWSYVAMLFAKAENSDINALMKQSEEWKNGDPLVDRISSSISTSIFFPVPLFLLYILYFFVSFTTYVTHLLVTYTYLFHTHMITHERMFNTYCIDVFNILQ